MLHVSGAVIAANVFLLAICFLLPLAIYFVLVKYGECESKPLVVGAIAFFAGGFLVDRLLLNGLYLFTDVYSNRPIYFLYTLLLSPAVFLLTGYISIKFFGKEMNTTGDAMMYSLGYTGLQNILVLGLTQLLALMDMLSINKTSSYIVVSDSRLVSYSDIKNVVGESSYNYLQKLTEVKASNLIWSSVDRLLIIAAYAAIIMVVWMAIRKQGSIVLLAAAFGMRIILALPSICSDMHILSGNAAILGAALIVTAVEWIAALMLRKKYIDKPCIG